MKDAAPLMRSLGVAQATIGPLTLVLGPEPKSPIDLAKEKSDPRHARRQHYTELLGHTPSNEALDNLP